MRRHLTPLALSVSKSELGMAEGRPGFCLSLGFFAALGMMVRVGVRMTVRVALRTTVAGVVTLSVAKGLTSTGPVSPRLGDSGGHAWRA